jgi:hypothetical protein
VEAPTTAVSVGVCRSPIQRGKALRNAQALRRSRVGILKAAQLQVIALFARFDALARGEGPEKSRLLHELGQALRIQLEVEEAFYYPAVQKMKGEFARRSVGRALQDHAEVKSRLKKLTARGSENRSVDLNVRALQNCVLSHFELEESQICSYSETLPRKTLHQVSVEMETLRERLRMNQRWAMEPPQDRDAFYPTLQDRNGAPEDDRDTSPSFASAGEANERHSSDFDDWGSD